MTETNRRKNSQCPNELILSYIQNGKNDEAKRYLQKYKHKKYRYSMNDDLGQTFLHHSVNHDNQTIVQYLLENGWDANASDNKGVTPLLIAVKLQNQSIVELLLKNNADMFACNSSGLSSLQHVIRLFTNSEPDESNSINRQILEILFKKLNDEFSENKDSMSKVLLSKSQLVKLVCLVFGNEELTKFMVTRQKLLMNHRIGRCGQTPLHCAIILKKFSNTKVLIEHGAYVHALNSFGYSPLYYYTDGFEEVDENHQVLSSILQSRVRRSTSFRRRESDELERLLTHGSKETVKVVLQSGIEIPATFEHDRTLLHLLVMNEDATAINLLSDLSIKYNVNARDYFGATALYYAAQYDKRLRQLGFLFESPEIDVNLCTHDNVSPLMVATNAIPGTTQSQRDNCSVTSFLLVRRPNIGQTLINDLCQEHLKKKKSTNVVLAHLAMLASIDKSLLADKYIPDIFKDYFDACMEQCEMMKNVKVHLEVHGTINYFQLIHESVEKVTNYMLNDQFEPAIVKGIISKMTDVHTHYLSIAIMKLSFAKRRKKYYCKAALIIDKMTGLCSDTYYLIVYKIMSYLSFLDLQSLCKIDIN